METSRCKAFIAAAETGSFSKAAELLSYTPSGVSQLVTALEADLGFALLRRTNKGVTVTSDGELLLPAIRELLNQEERIYQIAADTKGLLIGSVTIASYSSIATHWLPTVISRFQADYPQIKINLLEGIRQEVNKWLDDKTADIAFTSYKEPFPYDWIPLTEDPMMAVLPPDHPYAGADSYPIELCRSEKLILPGFGHDDDAIALSLSHHFSIGIQWVYLASDLIVLLMSLTYIPLSRIAYSLLTVILSGQIIGLIQKGSFKKLRQPQ